MSGRLRLIVLGSSSAVPTRTRNLSAYALQFADGGVWLLDCGEATQHRLLGSSLRPGRIERILISHLHADHVLGLPGLLMSMAIHGRTQPVHLLGPRGLQELVETCLRLTASHLAFPLHIRELAPEETAELAPAERPTWCLQAVPIVHRVPCHAFLLQAPPQRGAFDPVRARALGLPPGPLYGRLAAGETVQLVDGRRIGPSAVLGPVRAGARLALCGDTSDAAALEQHCRDGVDLLLHEATYADELQEKARDWGHSSAGMAGATAARLGARCLLLTHFSARHDQPRTSRPVDLLVQQAAAACPGCSVVPARDGLVLEWTGEAFGAGDPEPGIDACPSGSPP